MMRILSTCSLLAVLCASALAAFPSVGSNGGARSSYYPGNPSGNSMYPLGNSFSQGNPAGSPFYPGTNPSFPGQGQAQSLIFNPQSQTSCRQNEVRIYQGCAPSICTEGCQGSGMACSMVCQQIPSSGVCTCAQGYKRVTDGGDCVLAAYCSTYQQQQQSGQQQSGQQQSGQQQQQAQSSPFNNNLLTRIQPPGLAYPPVQTAGCGIYEIRRYDGCRPNICSEQCPNAGRMCATVCQSIPAGGVCTCAPGYYRVTTGGPCVPQSQCTSSPNEHPTCNLNEVLRTDLSCMPNACTEGCQEPRGRCMSICQTPPPQGVCACQTGYVRITYNGFQVCVPAFVCNGYGRQ